MVLIWEGLSSSKDAHLAAIAAKSLKETQYHLRHARDWLLRMGDGTDESHARVQAALTHLMPYTQEFWTPSAQETAAIESGAGVDTRTLQATWNDVVDHTLDQATLKRPSSDGFVTTGKQGVHSEHLGFVLSEMQSLARAHPEAVW
jgi:ring-1,2-phenylacetyl-CoA epoxidase subunit PaaC